MVRSGFDKETGMYFDCTTGRLYEPKSYCEICGANWKPLEVHHKLPQQKAMRDLKSKIQAPYIWTKEFIEENQRLYTVCRDCHNAIHSRGRKGTINGRNLKDYLYMEEKTEVVTKPRAFIVKRGEQ